jgi:hypothetical protein
MGGCSIGGICERISCWVGLRLPGIQSRTTMNDAEIKAEALRILQILIHSSFDECAPLSKKFESLPNRMGIYAVIHRPQEILYIGKAANLRYRFMEDTRHWLGL